ncbi:MAG TPA: hypothetical protein VHW45_14755 [Candidatus Sulfotelmatobacter sp.]|jgi:hypothetical protein|nr:hypothetical protein [Candidatus Sulfotelmatobacter sp.]
MPFEGLRTLSLDTIPDAIHLMNESSRGMSIEFHLDFLSFLVFKGYWNISSTHSFIQYAGGNPAAIILTSVDEIAREAYTVYWGSIPQFRTRQIAIALFETCCNALLADGYETLYGCSVPDRPVQRYRFIKASPQFQLFDLAANNLTLPSPDPAIQIRADSVSSALQLPIPSGARFEWTQRPNFLRHAASQLKFLGAYCDGSLKAYAVVRTDPTGCTALHDLRCPEGGLAPGLELLRHALAATSPPFTATNVADQSYSQRVLTEAGFTISRQFSSLIRDLHTTCSVPAQ